MLRGLRCCQSDWERVKTPSGDSQEYRARYAGVGALVRQVEAIPVTFMLD